MKTSRHFKKCTLKNFCRAQQKKQARVLVDFRRKQQDWIQVFYNYHETKLFGVYFNHVS
jgi:hypothetical protein